MRICLTLYTSPVVVYATILFYADGARQESGPFLDYARAVNVGRWSLLTPGVVAFTVQPRLADWRAAA